ncbi:MAG: hypothetical protein AABW89_00335 [Nanoarchaeota archaeon]
MGSIIQSVGTYSPERILTNQDLERILALSGQETSDSWIIERTGIHRRRVASISETVETMALSASLDAVKRLRQSSLPIQHIIVATNTHENNFPNVAGYVAEGIVDSYPHLIERSASGTDLSAGCGGVNFALMYADSLIKSRKFDSVLVLGTEHLSDVTDYRDRTTCVLFGDGASAYVLCRGETSGFLGDFPKGESSGRSLIYCENDQEKVTLQEALSALKDGRKPSISRGKVLRMNGKKVFRYVTECWRDLLEHFYEPRLNPDGIDFGDVGWIAPHLANLRCLENAGNDIPGFLDKCGLIGEDLLEFCNTSTASQGRRVKQFFENAKQGEYLLMHGYGAGLQSCANLYQQP